jgi:TolA-binding protein
MSNTEQTNDRVNIFLGNDSTKNEILSGASPQEKYIILVNDTLQTENRQHIDRVKELESQVEDLEGDIERMEKGKACLKGMLNNFNEMNKMKTNVAKIETEIRQETTNHIRLFKHKANKQLRMLEAFMVCVLGICYEWNFGNCYILAGVMMIFIADAESTIANLIIPTFSDKENKLNELHSEIKEADKAQDYIHELIESQ